MRALDPEYMRALDHELENMETLSTERLLELQRELEELLVLEVQMEAEPPEMTRDDE